MNINEDYQLPSNLKQTGPRATISTVGAWSTLTLKHDKLTVVEREIPNEARPLALKIARKWAGGEYE